MQKPTWALTSYDLANVIARGLGGEAVEECWKTVLDAVGIPYNTYATKPGLWINSVALTVVKQLTSFVFTVIFDRCRLTSPKQYRYLVQTQAFVELSTMLLDVVPWNGGRADILMAEAVLLTHHYKEQNPDQDSW